MKKTVSRRWSLSAPLLFASCCLMAGGSLPAAAQEEPEIEPFALQVLERMSGFVKSAQRLSYDAVTETVEIRPGRLPVRLQAEARVAVRRPDRLYVEIQSDEVHRRVTLNGERVRLHDLLANAYAIAETPGGVEATLDLLEGTLGVFVPLGQLVRRDPLPRIMEGVTALAYIGLEDVTGVQCHYLSARQADMAWEVWVERGPRPVPRKLVFHFTEEGGTTTFTSVVDAWGFPSHLPDEGFASPVAEGALEIPLRDVPRGGE